MIWNGLELDELRSNRYIYMIYPSIVGWFYQPSIVAEQPVVQVFRAAPRLEKVWRSFDIPRHCMVCLCLVDGKVPSWNLTIIQMDDSTSFLRIIQTYSNHMF